jgi:hypothetical protein|tara:strand:- start:357 stop:563 length:207 start_codon:yes stop_codon:yes gene_type:complete
MFGNGEPTTIKGMVAGISTISVWGINVNMEQVSFWTTILSDLGVSAAAITTVALGIKSWREGKDKDKK